MNNSFSDWRRLSLGGTTSSRSPQLTRSRVGISRRPSFSGHLLAPSPSVYHSSPGGNVPSTTGPLLTGRFLPSVKRALGLDSSPRSPITAREEPKALYPQQSRVGYLPAVKLGRIEKAKLNNSFSAVRSPNTVRIAPPDLNKLSSPRLFRVKPSNDNENRKAPDTQAVVTALKEKSRKRALDGTELPCTENTTHIAKRRRQESQQSNASTSSLPPLPDQLMDLSARGYDRPRLKTPTMKQSEDAASLKRSAQMTDLSEFESEEQASKRAKTDQSAVYNSIVSSLSSSRKLRQQAKRKVTEEKENNRVTKPKTAKVDKEPSDKSLQRAETLILPPDFDESKGVGSLNESTTIVNGKDAPADTTTPPPKLSVTPKRVSLNETFSARKRQMSLYSGLNESFKKAPQSQVVASTEDYEKDRQAEQSRGKELLQSLVEDEQDSNPKENKKLEEAKATLSALVGNTAATTSASSTSAANSTATLSTSLPALASVLSSSTVTTAAIGQPVTTPAIGQTAVSTSERKSPQTNAVSASSGLLATAGGLNFNFASGKIAAGSSSPSGAVSKAITMPSVLTALQGDKLSSSSASGFTFGVKTTTATSPSGTASQNPGINTLSPPTSVSSSTPSSLTSQAGFSFGVGSNLAKSPAPNVTFGSNPTSTTVSSLPGASGLNFSFGQATSQQVTATTNSSGFKLGAGATSTPSAPAPSSSAVPAFSATAQATSAPSTGASTAATPPTFNFAAGATSTSTSSTFTFGQSAKTSSSTFTFGQTGASKTTTAPPSAGFTFGQAVNTTNSSTPAFGNTTAVVITNSATSPVFSFGASAAPASTTSASNFSFGTSAAPVFGQASSTTTTTTKPGGFTFNPTPSTTSSGFGQGFTGMNGGPPPAATTTTSVAPSGIFTFGQTQPSAATVTTTSSAAPSGIFQFGQSQSAAGSQASGSSSVFAFGQSSNINPAGSTTSELPKPVFNFGGQSQSTAPAFGQTTNAGSSFSQTGSSGGVFAFGAQSGAATTTTTSSVFGATQPSFGAPGASATQGGIFGSKGVTQSSGQAFGQVQPGLPKPAFHSSQSAPVFGATATNQPSAAPAFGATATNQPSAAPTFGATATNQPSAAPAFGSGTSFGPSSTQQPSVFQFGQQSSTTQAGPVFGSTPAPSFGSTSGAAPVFGQPATTTASAPAPAFGQPSSSFGAPGGSGTGAFAFGMSTPQKSTPAGGFAFGTPQNQVHSAAPSQSTPATGQKGFDFSASLGGNSSFNFGSGSAPTFGAPAGAPPTFGAPNPSPGGNMFSMGTGGTGPRQRTMVRARRRNTKK